MVLNFDNAEIETVVHASSEILNFNYLLAPDVRGKVTIQTSGRIAYEDVFGVLLAVLEVHGFTAVKAGNLYKIVRIPDAATRPVPTIVGTTIDASRDGDEVITQIIPVRYSSVNDLRSLLQPLISPQRGGNVIAHRETNVLIITDTAANIRRLLDIVQLVDVEVSLEEVQIVPLQYADASEVAQILTQLFASGRIRPTAAAAPTAAPPPQPGAPPAPAAPGARAAPEAQTERPPMILPERRSNSLVVHAGRNELQVIRNLVSRLDVNISGGRRVFIYYAENAKAKDLAATMNSIYSKEGAAATAPGGQPGPPTAPPPPLLAPPPGTGGAIQVGFVEGQFKFIADEATNAVILATYSRLWGEIEQTLKELDRSPRQVLIEVLVAEVLLSANTRLGVEWAIRSGRWTIVSTGRTGDGGAGAIQPPPNIPIPPTGNAFLPILGGPGLTAAVFAADKFFAALNAFASDGLINVLSSPSILTSENKKAVINVSQSIPIVTSQQIPFGGTTTTQQPNQQNQAAVIGTQTVEYRDAGVILTVTPRIGEQGTVALDIKQEVNDVDEASRATSPTGSPTIRKREAETSVVLLNNQTLVLGGLIQDRRTQTNTGIPWFRKIPVVGFLFSTNTEAVEKTELLMVITPRVIGTALDAARITDALRRANPQAEKSFQRAPALPPTSPGLKPVPSVKPGFEPATPAPQAPGAPGVPGLPMPPRAPQPSQPVVPMTPSLPSGSVAPGTGPAPVSSPPGAVPATIPPSMPPGAVPGAGPSPAPPDSPASSSVPAPPSTPQPPPPSRSLDDH